jgi:hypothetical protein
MASQPVPNPPFGVPLVDRAGFMTSAWRIYEQAKFLHLGGKTDKVEAAHLTAIAAVPKTTEVVAGGGLQIGGALAGNVGLALYRGKVAVAGLPTTGNSEGDLAYALNGRKVGEGAGSGTGVPVWWSGTHWYAFWSSAVVTA